MENGLYELFSLSPTKTSAAAFINKLIQVSDSLYRLNGDINDKLDQFLTLEEKQLLLKVTQKERINIANPVQFQKLIAELKDEILKIPVISVTTAITPTPQIIKSIQNWLQKSTPGKFFLELRTQPEIMGGIIISYGGKIKEISLRKLFRAKFGNHQL